MRPGIGCDCMTAECIARYADFVCEGVGAKIGIVIRLLSNNINKALKKLRLFLHKHSIILKLVLGL